MKKLIFTACAMLAITACTSKDDPEKTGQMYLSQARDYLGFERFKEARAAIDSLRARFGTGAVVRGAVFADPDMALPLAQEEYTFVRKPYEGLDSAADM